MRERCKFLVSMMIVLTLIFVFISCAKPPDVEKSAARGAMDTAVSVGAEKYAIADFKSAKALWDTAEFQMADKKYEEAKQSYIDAKAAFEKSSSVGRKAVTDAANAALPSLEEFWKNLQIAANSAEKNIKDKKEDWDADSKAITEGLRAAKDMIATDPAGAKAKIDELKAVIDKWDAVLKEPAAAPAKTVAPKKK